MAKITRTHILPSTSELNADKYQNPEIKQSVSDTRKWADKILQFLDSTLRKIAEIPFNQSDFIDVADTGTADTEFTVSHHLDRVPSGFIVTKSDKAVSVYDSGTTWTKTAVYLKCSAANAAITILLF